jgi:hypothetical protein
MLLPNKRYIIAKARLALSDLLDVPVNPISPSDPTQPTVLPKDTAIFPEEIMLKLGFYRDKVVEVEDFEGFSELLQSAAEEFQLNPATDLEKIAAVFNQFRLDAGKNPI